MAWFWGSSSSTSNRKKDSHEEDDSHDSNNEDSNDDDYEDDDDYTDDEDEYDDEDNDEGSSGESLTEGKGERKQGNNREEKQETQREDNAAVIDSKGDSEQKIESSKQVHAAAAATKSSSEKKAGDSKDEVKHISGRKISNVPSSYAQEFDTDDEEEEEEEAVQAQLERIEANIPEQVVGNRTRAPSVLTVGEDDDDENESNASVDLDESSHSEVSNENEHVTSLAEKQSLLVLAAEHDRVDILNSILSDADAGTKEELLHGGIPPLHIAVLHGSTNTATCLLRLGADPSIRPNVREIQQDQDPQAPVQVPKQIDGVTAWELAFQPKNKKSSIPKNKQQGIMNAFSAEALRCMGSDEGTRLSQLLAAGMPNDMPIMGDKSLYDWAVELGAPQCEEVLRPAQAAKHELTTTSSTVSPASPSSGGKSAVIDRPGTEESAHQLTRQLEELESLAKALSTCLDSLAEEVSVSHGLLLMGGGASALASHVRSLKSLKEQKSQELSRHQEAFENTQDEIEYWIKQAGPRGQTIAAEEMPVVEQFIPGVRKHLPPPHFQSTEEEQEYCGKLQARIHATHEKVRKFRVSIADLSEENDRNMQEVEKRGLTGGINLVRGLKDEIREIDFSLEEVRAADAVVRAKIEKIQSILDHSNDQNVDGNTAKADDASAAGTSKGNAEVHINHVNGNRNATAIQQQPSKLSSSSLVSEEKDIGTTHPNHVIKPSEQVASGQSTALTVRREGPGPGLFPLSIWQILLRIIGLRDHRRPRRREPSTTTSSSSPPAMIV